MGPDGGRKGLGRGAAFASGRPIWITAAPPCSAPFPFHLLGPLPLSDDLARGCCIDCTKGAISVIYFFVCFLFFFLLLLYGIFCKIEIFNLVCTKSRGKQRAGFSASAWAADTGGVVGWTMVGCSCPSSPCWDAEGRNPPPFAEQPRAELLPRSTAGARWRLGVLHSSPVYLYMCAATTHVYKARHTCGCICVYVYSDVYTECVRGCVCVCELFKSKTCIKKRFG